RRFTRELSHCDLLRSKKNIGDRESATHRPRRSSATNVAACVAFVAPGRTAKDVASARRRSLASRQHCGRQRMRLNQSRDRSPETSASTAAAAAKSAEISVSRCSKKSLVFKFL